MPAGGVLAFRARLAASIAVLAMVLGPAALAQPVGNGEPGQWSAAACRRALGPYRFRPLLLRRPELVDASQCDKPEKPLSCGDHGRSSNGWCVCETGWKGSACQIATLSCTHGKAAHGKCVCEPGWSGDTCNKKGG